ncbi:MAG: DUF6288 domain-containing protein [Phycisphaerae bacterium]|nr:DUF6288 domain-containing protein [Phycisphaerae bacterium]
MNMVLNRKNAILVLVAVIFCATFTCGAARKASPKPDFTKGGVKDNSHDWNLGPTGARGWIYGRKGNTGDARQILITDVAKNSPADGILKKGDVILGVGGKPFDGDARIQFAKAVMEAEERRNSGRMQFLRWREGKTENVTLRLKALGTYSETAPYDCDKSREIFEQGCRAIAKKGLGGVSIPNSLNALALLASGRKEYSPMLAEYARKVAEFKTDSSWYASYTTIFLAEYAAATGDKSIMPGLRRLALEIARGASPVGTYGHRYAGPDGRCPGYGAMNQPTLTLWMAMIISREAGIKHPDLDKTIATTAKYMKWYENKGAIPYGDHFPWFGHEDNGKCSSATVCFDLIGDRETAEFYAKMSTAAYNERERGHTGNFFNVLWAMPGVSRCGEFATGAYMKELGWYYDLAREYDGAFGYQGSPQGEEEHGKYTSWDCTGKFMLAYALPLKSLYITGKKPCTVRPLDRKETKEVIEAGRGVFLEKEKNGSLYVGRSPEELIAGLSSWSPIVRGRSAKSLSALKEDYVPTLVKMLDSSDTNTRYGACQALGFLGERAKRAAPKVRALLRDSDPWMQCLACEAIFGLGSEVYKESVDDLLRMAVSSNPADLRNVSHRYAAKALFNRYKGSHSRIVQAGLLDSIDRKLLYPAISSVLKNEDGWARSFPGNLYKDLPKRDLKVLMPDIVKAAEELAPSGIMFASGIRTAGLKVLADNKIKEGLPLCLELTEIEKWGKKNRVLSCLKSLESYGPAAVKTILPNVKELEKRMLKHREAKGNLIDSVILIRKIIAEAEKATGEPEFVSLKKFMDASADTGQDLWMTDYKAALAKAKAENKDVLIDFTGSDWCHWCIKLDKEVFEHKEFIDKASKDFVFLMVDTPRKKKLAPDLMEQNKRLKERYSLRGYPTVYLTDCKGNPYAKTGYRKGGPEKYLVHLAELRKNKNSD